MAAICHLQGNSKTYLTGAGAIRMSSHLEDSVTTGSSDLYSQKQCINSVHTIESVPYVCIKTVLCAFCVTLSAVHMQCHAPSAAVIRSKLYTHFSIINEWPWGIVITQAKLLSMK